MSEESKDAKGNREVSSYQEREKGYKLWSRGYVIADIAEKLGYSERTIYRWKDGDEWEDRREKETAIARKQEQLTEAELAVENIHTLNRLLHKAISLLEDAMGSTKDLLTYRGAIRDYGNLLDKTVRALAFVDNGGADQTKVHSTNEKLDWNELIKQSLEAKKLYGEDFDDREFAKKVIESKFKKKK